MFPRIFPRDKIKLPDVDNDVKPFSIGFTKWVEKHGFLVRETWDADTYKWAGAGWLQLLPHQREILDLALQMQDGVFKYSTVLFSTIKKSGKTMLGAAVGSWYAEVAPPGTEIYVIANDLESAEGRVMRDIKYHAAHRGYAYTKYEVTLPNGTSIKALAQNYRSVAGTRHALTIWDELWGITSELTRRTYEEMTPIPTIPWSLRFIATYAGFINESDLLWELYINGVGRDEHEDGHGKLFFDQIDKPIWENGRQFTYWNHEPNMPWQSPDYYEEQRDSLRPAAYLRLHENRWVTTHEEFIPIEWWSAAEVHFPDSAELWKDHPYAKFPVYMGVDAAPKRDSTSVVGVTYDPSKGVVIELFHRIWTPINVQLDLDETMKQFIIDMTKRFLVIKIGYDPSHLYQLMLNLYKDGFPVSEFTQTVSNMTRASQNLYDLLKFRRFYTYKDDEARTHIQNTVAQAESGGMRIVKIQGSPGRKKPVDYSIALAIAAYLAVQGGGIDVSQPLTLEAPFSDLTAWKNPSDRIIVPWQFRT